MKNTRYSYNTKLVKQFLKAWAGSLVRIGRRPPKPVVVGSNPTPPAIETSWMVLQTTLMVSFFSVDIVRVQALDLKLSVAFSKQR